MRRTRVCASSDTTHQMPNPRDTHSLHTRAPTHTYTCTHPHTPHTQNASRYRDLKGKARSTPSLAPKMLGFLLDHVYAGELSPEALKGTDLALYEALAKAGLPIHIVPVQVRSSLCVRVCTSLCVAYSVCLRAYARVA